MNSWDKFDETQLPKKEDLYSHLYEENITDKDYARANIVWKHFNIKNLGEYHDLYLMTDVYLLTDVFENFRDMCLNYYGLDPAYYLTLTLRMGSPSAVNLLGLTTPNIPLRMGVRSTTMGVSALTHSMTPRWANSLKTSNSSPRLMWTLAWSGAPGRSAASNKHSFGCSKRYLVRP